MARGAERRARPAAAAPPAEAPLGATPRRIAAVFASFLALALGVYAPALRGPFISDDLHYVATNPYVHALTLENVRAILGPWSPASIFVVNYTPVHLLLHALAWQAFGDHVLGHHVVNVVFHAAASSLLVALLAGSGLPFVAALAGGALFLLHPANVEAVAWISQLKTTSCMVLSLITLLLFPRRPALATPFFFLALLAKPTACFLLPVAAVLAWCRAGEGRTGRRIAWLALWTIGFAVLAVAQIEVNRRNGTPDLPLELDPALRVRTALAIAARYLAISASSIGVSAFHEPPRAVSWLDPWWVASVPALTLLGLRTLSTLKARREEAAWWVFAASSFVPVSQIFPFLYPMADRYLYFILPGLIGGSLLAGRDLLLRLHARAPDLAAAAVRPLAIGALALALAFGLRSHARAALWTNPLLLLADAGDHYPDGVAANLLRARRAAQIGDVDAAVAALDAAIARGFNRFEQLEGDPAFAPIRSDPRFRARVARMADGWIARVARLPDPTQMELHVAAQASLARGDLDGAARLLERAARQEGPIGDIVRADLAEVERRRAAASGR